MSANKSLNRASLGHAACNAFTIDFGREVLAPIMFSCWGKLQAAAPLEWKVPMPEEEVRKADKLIFEKISKEFQGLTRDQIWKSPWPNNSFNRTHPRALASLDPCGVAAELERSASQEPWKLAAEGGCG